MWTAPTAPGSRWTGAARPGGTQPAPGPATIASADGPPVDFTHNPAAREAVARVLQQLGINPAGTVDLRKRPEVREAAGAGDPYARIQKLTELKASGLIGDAEYDAQKARILREI